MRTGLVSIVGLAAGLALTTGCAPISSITIAGGRPPARIEGGGPPGPPPHAPAHGYRRKQRSHGGGEVDLVFDAGLGVYVVVGVPNRYFWDGYYLRLDDDQWYASVDLDGDGGWEPRSEGKVPPGLQKKRGHSKGPKGRGNHGPHPAKGRW